MASPRRQWSDRGLRVTQDAYFSLLSHTKQLLLVTFSDTTAGIEASFRTDGRTDRRGSRKSYLDKEKGDENMFQGRNSIILITFALTTEMDA